MDFFISEVETSTKSFVISKGILFIKYTTPSFKWTSIIEKKFLEKFLYSWGIYIKLKIMKHILNNLTEEEKNAIREQHAGGMKVMTENFSKLINSKLGDSKPLVSEQSEEEKNNVGQ